MAFAVALGVAGLGAYISWINVRAPTRRQFIVQTTRQTPLQVIFRAIRGCLSLLFWLILLLVLVMAALRFLNG
ncbi:MAG: hypothetical protein GXO55_11075 [Chloroflexi bacterium]|nr:hypothetical protein [Chloroflexota bacterium]